MNWRDMFPYFFRKEIVQLQYSNRFFVNAVEKVKPAPLHVIDNLHIEMNDNGSSILLFTSKLGDNEFQRIKIKDFCLPSYLRFSQVHVHTLIISAHFMKRLENYKNAFVNCNLCLAPTFFCEQSANETMERLMDNIFTDCKAIDIRECKWNSASEMKFCSFSGVNRCNVVMLENELSALNGEEPIFESMIEWLHAGEGGQKRVLELVNFMGCQQMIEKLVLRFADDAELHFYVLYVTSPDLDFLNAFEPFSIRKTSTNEVLVSTTLDDDNDDGVIFSMARLPTGTVLRK